MRLSVAIQHHPSRACLLPPLLASLGNLDVEVVADPEPDAFRSAWRTYRHALERTPAWATHRVVLQDDVVVCRDFDQVLPRVVAACECRLVTLCVCPNQQLAVHAVTLAQWRESAWASLHLSPWVPAIGNVWPVELIEPVLAFVDAQNWPPKFCADDEIIGRALSGIGQVAWATVPSIVDHPDTVPSVASGRNRGVDPGRSAYYYEEDVSGVDWSE